MIMKRRREKERHLPSTSRQEVDGDEVQRKGGGKGKKGKKIQFTPTICWLRKKKGKGDLAVRPKEPAKVTTNGRKGKKKKGAVTSSIRRRQGWGERGGHGTIHIEAKKPRWASGEKRRKKARFAGRGKARGKKFPSRPTALRERGKERKGGALPSAKEKRKEEEKRRESLAGGEMRSASAS